MGCGCGGASNRYNDTAQPEDGRQVQTPAPAVTGLPKVWQPRHGQPVNGPKPK